MSPETLVEDTKMNDVSYYLSGQSVNSVYSVAANGSSYRKDFDGVLPQIIEEYYDERVSVKKIQHKSKYKRVIATSLIKRLTLWKIVRWQLRSCLIVYMVH